MIELRTERLLLRRFVVGDVDDALAYRNDEAFARYLPHIPQPFTPDDARAFVALNAAEPSDRSPTFAVVFDGRMIGTVNLEIDAAQRTAMLGYAIGRESWGKGIALEASRAVIAWAFEAFAVATIWATTDVRNHRSIRVLEKLGMTRERVLLANITGRDGAPIDEVRYSLARDR